MKKAQSPANSTASGIPHDVGRFIPMHKILSFVIVLALGSLIFLAQQPVGTNLSPIQSDDTAISDAIRAYAMNAGRPPTTEQGLHALASQPATGPQPKRWVQLMFTVPTDPWGHPYLYHLISENAEGWTWEVRSAGEDGRFNTRDDLAYEAHQPRSH